MKELTVNATLENLDTVLDFVNGALEEANCSSKAQIQIAIAVEEIYVNIAHYAYNPDIGKATIKCEVGTDPLTVTIQFLDNGTPYNPLKKSDPDIKLSAEEREIGGLGIFMVKKSMDELKYDYVNGQNILTIIKKI